MSDDDASPTSRLPGLFKRSVAERRRAVESAARLTPNALDSLDAGLTLEQAEQMIENVLGLCSLPLGVATNFIVDGREVLVPMAIEEPSVVAAASNAARMVRAGGGFVTESDRPLTIAQVELRDVPDADAAIRDIRAAESDIRGICNETSSGLITRGGGYQSLELRPLSDGTTLVVHLLVDCRDAMGANIVNTIAEAVAPTLAQIAGARPGLCILSNLADRRLVRVRCSIPVEALLRGDVVGSEVAEAIAQASRFAEIDPYRAATHNKGIMNGIDAVALATANDWRAVEAGAHAYAVREGTYRPLSLWTVVDDHLQGLLELPLGMATVGGAASFHPTAAVARQIIGTEDASELGGIAAAAGLATNLASLAALSIEGIQEGHMALHRRRLKKP
jgi:hydroxymethylglutaryl-CoA reductase